MYVSQSGLGPYVSGWTWPGPFPYSLHGPSRIQRRRIDFARLTTNDLFLLRIVIPGSVLRRLRPRWPVLARLRGRTPSPHHIISQSGPRKTASPVDTCDKLSWDGPGLLIERQNIARLL
jgi:hypothetical protein